jgi:[calcium/calmodulin-dependent protein kinase] kinase
VQREIAVMKKLTHTNVLRLYEVIDDEEEDKLYMIMDYCNNGPILDWDSEQGQFISPWNDNQQVG